MTSAVRENDGSPGQERLTLSNGRVALQLMYPDDCEAVVGRLCDYFEPWFQADGDQPPTVTLLLRVEDYVRFSRQDSTRVRERHDRIRSHNKNTTQYVERCRTAGTQEFFRFTESGSLLFPEPDRTCFELIASSFDSLFADTKELIQCHITRPLMLMSGASLLHSAACVIDGRAWLIAGEKRSGKTTTQMHLGRGGALLMSADRTYIVRERGTFTSYGYPARSSLMPDTFTRYPELGAGDGLVPDGPMKRLMSVSEIARRLGTATRPTAELGGVIVLTRSGPTKILGGQASLSALESFWLHDNDPLVPDWLFQRQATAEGDGFASVKTVTISSESLLGATPTGAVRYIARLADQAQERL